MLRLYDFLPSGNGYRVRLALSQLGIPFHYQELDILRGETREPWFLAKNPMGQIPLLEFEDGTRLSESTAILFWLAEGSQLLPAQGMDRIAVQRWIAFEQSSIDGVVSRARFRRLFPGVVATEAHEFEAWLADGYRALGVMEQHLQNRDFFVAGRYSIADIALYSYTHCAAEGGFDLSRFPKLVDWCQRVAEQPGYVAINERPKGAGM